MILPNFPIDEDLDAIAAIIARLVVLIDPSFDEYQAFAATRDYIYKNDLDLKGVDELVKEIKNTKLQPDKDTVH